MPQREAVLVRITTKLTRFANLGDTMDNNTFGEHAWALAEETIAELPPGILSIGIGNDLVRKSGYTHREVFEILEPVFSHLIDGGANKFRLNDLDVYARTRGKAVDFGTRVDFAELGWLALCDVLDAGGATPSTE